jgi:elongation factor G
VLDGAVCLLDANAGVEPQTETVWRQADRYKVPRIVFVNKMDKTGADFFNCVNMIKSRTGAVPLPIQMPIGSEGEFEGLISLVSMQEWVWKGEDLGASWEIREIRPELREQADAMRAEMIELVVDQDDDVMEAYLEGEEPDIDTLRRLIRKGALASDFVPILCGSAFKNKGVQPLLNAVIDYLPGPLDVAAYVGFKPGDETETRDIERRADDAEPFSGLAFKIMNDPFMGTLTFTRIYSGVLKKGDQILNATKGKRERIGRILQMHANNREELKEIRAGNIAAAVGLKTATTGDTLCDDKAPIILERMDFPEPVISVAIEPKTKADQDKLGMGLTKLAAEDPSFRAHTDEESGQTIISGMGELHLEIIVDRLKREFKVDSNVGAPQVAYRESITKEVEAEGRYVKQTGGRGMYGHVRVRLEPLESGGGFEFENKIIGGAIPREFIPAVSKGIRDAMTRGVMAGYPVIDIKATLYDGSYHDVDSSQAAFEVAGSLAFQEGARRAGIHLLEPVMEVEVRVPEDYMGDVIGDLNSRRGNVGGMDSVGGLQVIRSEVPLANMFGYVNDLRSKTQGRAVYTMQFKEYQAVPGSIADEIVAKAKGG